MIKTKLIELMKCMRIFHDKSNPCNVSLSLNTKSNFKWKWRIVTCTETLHGNRFYLKQMSNFTQLKLLHDKKRVGLPDNFASFY